MGNVAIFCRDWSQSNSLIKIGHIDDNGIETFNVPGDIILYQGKYLVIYYDTNSWNFTRLGKIDNVTQAVLKSALGEGGVRVTLSLE